MMPVSSHRMNRPEPSVPRADGPATRASTSGLIRSSASPVLVVQDKRRARGIDRRSSPASPERQCLRLVPPARRRRDRPRIASRRYIAKSARRKRVLGSVAVHGIHRDADRRAGLAHLVGDGERPFQEARIFFAEANVIGNLGIGCQHRELSPPSRAMVSVARSTPRSRAVTSWSRLSRGRDERVVDVLETVRGPGAETRYIFWLRRRCKHAWRSVAEQPAVGQAGQCVVQRPGIRAHRYGLALGDVAQRGDEQVARTDLHRADTNSRERGCRSCACPSSRARR